jgi:hypothetical protein
MRLVNLGLATVGLASLCLSAVIAHAVLAPLPKSERLAEQRPAPAVVSAWETTVTRE